MCIYIYIFIYIYVLTTVLQSFILSHGTACHIPVQLQLGTIILSKCIVFLSNQCTVYTGICPREFFVDIIGSFQN